MKPHQNVFNDNEKKAAVLKPVAKCGCAKQALQSATSRGLGLREVLAFTLCGCSRAFPAGSPRYSRAAPRPVSGTSSAVQPVGQTRGRAALRGERESA